MRWRKEESGEKEGTRGKLNRKERRAGEYWTEESKEKDKREGKERMGVGQEGRKGNTALGKRKKRCKRKGKGWELDRKEEIKTGMKGKRKRKMMQS